MKKRYLFISIGLILLIVVMLFTGKGKKVRDRKERERLTVDTIELATQDFDVSKDYIGTLYPEHKFELRSNVGGRIVEMNFDVGDRIENGSTIALIDDTQFLLELRQEKGRLQIEESKVRQKEMSIQLAETTYNRMLALGKLVTDSVLDKAKFEFEQSKMTLDVDKANLEMQETSVAVSELRWSYTKIEARWASEAGHDFRFLGERFVDQGAMITSNTVIATIIDIGVLKAEIFVGEKEYPHFKPGMKVNIEVDAFPRELFGGSVARVAPFINEQTRQAKVLVSVKNEDLRLRPGMFARTSVIFSTRTGVPMLPKVCILEKDGKQGVYLYDAANSKVSFLPVKIGAVRQGQAEILNADEINQPVVSVGQHMVKDGDSVNHVSGRQERPEGEEKQPARQKKRLKKEK